MANQLNLYYVQDHSFPLYVVEKDWKLAIDAWRRKFLENAGSYHQDNPPEPDGVQLICTGDKLLLNDPVEPPLLAWKRCAPDAPGLWAISKKPKHVIPKEIDFVILNPVAGEFNTGWCCYLGPVPEIKATP